VALALNFRHTEHHMHVDADIEGRAETTDLPRAAGRLARQWRTLTDYHILIKSRQTLLLYATGICAYLLSLERPVIIAEAVWLSLTLLFSICGCTVLNMLVDRDIDAKMARTHTRPLVTGALSIAPVTTFGVALSLLGLGIAFWLGVKIGLIIAAGFVFDLGIYSMWLKRRTPLSIVLGGISGGMPALAGRTLAIGHVDPIGLLLTLSILLWVPSHFVTLTMKYRHDYRRAGVPVWPNVFGEVASHRFIAIANLLNGGVLLLCGRLLHIAPAAFVLLVASTATMLGLALLSLVRPGDRLTWAIFKSASIYMLLSFMLITFGVLL
jgi:heme o synthase